jgi:hypothetical protein
LARKYLALLTKGGVKPNLFNTLKGNLSVHVFTI